MGYYYKSNDIRFSSYACVKYMRACPKAVSDNEIKLFNNCIKIITAHERHLTEATVDGFDTYFFGVLIHRRLDKNAYDIYCSSKSYAYFVIKYLHNVAHDDYEKVYTIIHDKIGEFQKWLCAMPVEEQEEFKVNFERNFRIEMMNELSKMIHSSVEEASNHRNEHYISVLMAEIVNTIIQTHAQEQFMDISDKTLLGFMERYEQGQGNIESYEEEFLAAFFRVLTKRHAREDDFVEKVQQIAKKKGYIGIVKYEIKNDVHIFEFPDIESLSRGFNLMDMKSALIKYGCSIESKILRVPTLAKRIQDNLKENISSEKILKKTISNILQSKEEEIKRLLLYTDLPIVEYSNLNVEYAIEHLPTIALILKRFVPAFIGEANINFYHQNAMFYNAVEASIHCAMK